MRLFILNLFLFCFCLLFSSAQFVQAGEVLMVSGYRIHFVGKPTPVKGLTLEQIRQKSQGPVPSFPFTMVDAGPQRYYFPQSVRTVVEITLDDPYVEEFVVDLPPAHRGQGFGTIGGFLNTSPFSEFGRRTVKMRGSGKILEFMQEISKIRPDYVELTAKKYNWVYAVDTKTIPAEVLRNTISHTIDENSHEDRLAIVRLFISCENYLEAQTELRRISADFEDLDAKVKELRLVIRQLQATQAINEFKRRLDAGQYNLVYDSAKNKFPRGDINQASLQEVDNIIREHEKALEQIELAKSSLANLQAEVKDEKLLDRFKDMRSVVSSRLSRHNLERMRPFLQNAEDDFLSANEKLSLAYSAWIVGPALAETDAETTIHFWDTHDRVLDYLRGDDPIEQQETLEELKRIEGISPQIVAAILKHLEPVWEAPAGNVGEPILLETLESSFPVSYQAILPVEYSSDRTYPLVVALHAGGMQPENELVWWGGSNIAGPAHRNGFIVIAPDYLQDEGETGIGSAESHQRVVDAIRDARKRFSVDSDRIYLVGHGLGGDAVFDIGMAHPDLFAGAVVIAGRINDYCRHYWENCKTLPFYVVVGELDGETFQYNAGVLTRMMKYRQDVILTEYKQRGHESYHEELPNILEWMKHHQRAKLPQEFKMKTMRPSDNRFYWIEFSGLPASLTKPRVLRNGKILPPSPLPIEGKKANAGNTLYIKAAAKHVTLWLNPEVINFDERLKIRWKNRTTFNKFPEQNISHMLQHVHTTGDRQRLYWLRIDL